MARGIEEKNIQLPLLPLRGLLAFPEMTIYFDVGRERSIAALEQAMVEDKRVFLVAQRDVMCDDPSIEDMYGVGTIAHVKHMIRMPDETVRVLCEGESRALLLSVNEQRAYQLADIAEMPVVVARDDLEIGAYMMRIKAMAVTFFSDRGRVPGELMQSIQGCDDPAVLADMIAVHVLRRLGDKQLILECRDVLSRLQYLTGLLAREIDLQRIDRRIEDRVNASMERNQREYYLREQLKVIQTELGGDEEQEVEAMRDRLSKLEVPDEVREKASREIDRFDRMQRGTPEGTVSQTYIDWLLDMPWGKFSGGKIDIPRARKILDADHYGLEKVKNRVLEYLSVRALTGNLKGPILCLVGPPGVGKTSIARSVARALKRKFVRMSLGGVHDEAEIRGHRRTYIGAIPGRIASSVKQAGVMDPVFLLDEIDKITSDMRGDPASALLEALDPEQNATFTDHYLDVPLDLSKILFITTANTVETIPHALLDRMEVVEVPSYTLEEKVQIAKRHLWPKQLKEHAMKRSAMKLSDAALRAIIEGYTREAGVRALERELAAICRHVALSSVESGEAAGKIISIKPDDLKTYLGVPRYTNMSLTKAPEIGAVNGLAWTQVGGMTLPIEVAVMPGEGKVDLTGKLGDVMKESARTALSYIRSKSGALNVSREFYKSNDLHIHVPEGGVSKDGPSAGVAMTCAMVSAITGKFARQDIAMTGEVTLRGKVLPIGGAKEKLLAAYRMGIPTVLLPRENEKDLSELPKDIREKLDVRLIDQVDQALDAVLIDSPARSSGSYAG